MEDDIGLVGYQYNIVLTIFFCMYFAYVISAFHGQEQPTNFISVEVPSNITLKHVGPKWYRGWHSISCLIPQDSDKPQFLASCLASASSPFARPLSNRTPD